MICAFYGCVRIHVVHRHNFLSVHFFLVFFHSFSIVRIRFVALLFPFLSSSIPVFLSIFLSFYNLNAITWWPCANLPSFKWVAVLCFCTWYCCCCCCSCCCWPQEIFICWCNQSLSVLVCRLDHFDILSYLYIASVTAIDLRIPSVNKHMRWPRCSNLYEKWKC